MFILINQKLTDNIYKYYLSPTKKKMNKEIKSWKE